MTLFSVWGETIQPKAPLQEYPRMHLQRDSYFNLNGIWKYQITDQDDKPFAEGWRNIVVPFALGSKLCGSEEQLKPGKVLWYRREFAYHPNAKRAWLHFEAVDMECTVYLNGMEIGSHKGGYTPFSFDVSEWIKYQNELVVCCKDDTDYGNYAYGKQKIEHSGMWYTPSSGIWGTVWMEELPDHAIKDIKITPDYDHSCVKFELEGRYKQASITIAHGKQIFQTGITSEKQYTAVLKDFHPWSPEDPYLYDVYIATEDEMVRSYFGMRKFARERDEHGIPRFFLNNKPYFFTGLLDQGYSVDGLYTYPSEDAIRYELQKVKDLGFNMLRKHIKIESRRWYYECDRLGLLVMQDMPSGGYGQYDLWTMGILPNLGIRRLNDTKQTRFGRKNAACKETYYEELQQMLRDLYNFTSIFCWVPFNEGWGQFDSAKVTELLRNSDPTRLIDSASGWHDQGCGDFNSIHNYFLPYIFRKDRHNRITILSEFGGYAYVDKKHSEPKEVYGYKKYEDLVKWNNAVIALYEKSILANIRKGLSGCIYTQLCDVEDECNGLLTADRRVVKIDEKKMKHMNHMCRRRIRK